MSKNYTAHNDERINSFVTSHLEVICKRVKELMDNNVTAIILSGGFGRGEGSIIERDDNSLHVINDYDIDIIYREKYNKLFSKIYTHLKYRKKINNIASELAEYFDIKQIDLNLKTAKDLQPESYPNLADYDLAHGHVVLYGNDAILSNTPIYEASQIPAFEGTWLLRNRGIGLLLASFYIKEGIVDPNKLEYFYIEINKAILAMGDALFLLKGKYECSYATRREHFEELCDEDIPRHKLLKQLYNNAAQYKLFPCKNMHTDYDSTELYNLVCRLYCDFFLHYEERRLKQPFKEISDYDKWTSNHQIENKLKYKSRQLFEKLMGKSYPSPKNFIFLKLDKQRSVAVTMTLLFNTANQLEDAEFMSNMTILLGNKTILNFSPNELKRLFLLLIHPKGELGRTLR